MQGRLSIAALAVCTLAGTAWAQEPAAHGDARHGKAISYTCLGCHGIEGYKNAYPMYSVPKLEGQNPDYLAAALRGYRYGDRAHGQGPGQRAAGGDAMRLVPRPGRRRHRPDVPLARGSAPGLPGARSR